MWLRKRRKSVFNPHQHFRRMAHSSTFPIQQARAQLRLIKWAGKVCWCNFSTLGWPQWPVLLICAMMPWYPATRGSILIMNILYINRDVIRSQAKLTLLCWYPCVVFKYTLCKWRLILLHLICFSLAINTSLWQLIILSGSGVPPCCLPFGHLSHHISHQAYHAFLPGHTSFIHLRFKILSHIFKESWWGVELWHLSIYRMSFF